VTDTAAPRVVLVRHAHADWPHYQGRDFDRPLTPRGIEDAARSAEAIRAAGLVPTLLLTSPAQRTRETAAILAKGLALPEVAIRNVDGLYNASAGALELELRRAARPGSVTMLVAHNPGISELARQLADDPAFRSFAPGAWAQFELPPG
jgi:phosphohistidine phosphatase